MQVTLSYVYEASVVSKVKIIYKTFITFISFGTSLLHFFSAIRVKSY